MEEQPMMRWGGDLHQYQTDGQVREFEVRGKKVPAQFIPWGSQIPQGYNPVETIPNLYEKPGTPGLTNTVPSGSPSGTPPGKGSPSFNRAFAAAKRRGDKSFIWNGKTYGTELYTPGKKTVTIPGTDPNYLYTEPSSGETTTTTTLKPDMSLYIPEVDTKGEDIPYGWDIRHKMALNNALSNLAGLKKDMVDYAKVTPYTPKTAMNEWLSKAQERQQAFRTAADVMGQTMPGQSLASNLSFMAGKTGEGVTQDIDATNQGNIQRYIDNEREKASILNNAALYNAGVIDRNREARFDINRQFGADKRTAKNAALEAWIAGKTGATNTYNLGITESPYYYYDPNSGRMVFNSAAGRAAFEQMKRKGYAGSGNYSTQQTDAALAIYKRFYESAPGTPEQKAAAAKEAMSKIMGGNKAAAAVTSKYGGQPQAAYGYTYNNPFLI